MTLDRERPEILTPAAASPGLLHAADHHRPAGRERETRQRHDYPSAAWRCSYARRTGAERGFATVKDPAASDTVRGWCRLIGLALLTLFTTTLLVVRNRRIIAAWTIRQEENQRRAARACRRSKTPPRSPPPRPSRHRPHNLGRPRTRPHPHTKHQDPGSPGPAPSPPRS